MSNTDSSKLGAPIVKETSLDKPPKTDRKATVVCSHEHSPATVISDAKMSSTYHIFWRKTRRHFLITPVDCPERDRPWKKPTFKYKEGNGRQQQEVLIDVFEADLLPDVAADTYFVHHPYISFRNPPRTFRRGGTKNSPTLALINNSWFWRKWKLQFGERLADDRVIDPRGAVSLPCGSAKTCFGEKAVKGYKVRKWRLWGETGKLYHHRINARRQGEDKEKRKSNADYVQELALHDKRPAIDARETIDEVIHFSWNSPFTRRTRDYHFQHEGIDFYWKGTGTVKEGRTCGACLHFNHLKLMARLPFTGSNIVDSANKETGGAHATPVRRSSGSKIWQRSTPTFRELCIAKYTSSVGKKKAGTLLIYDEALHDLMKDSIITNDGNRPIDSGNDVASVKQTRLFDIIIATAMCMVIGEWQKRKWLKKIIALAAGEAGGNAGGS